MGTKMYSPEFEIRKVNNHRNSDSKLLKILSNKEYLDIDTQDYILSSTDINEMYSTIDDIFLILNKKKRKLKNKESFLNTEDEDNLTLFLGKLNEEILLLNGKVKEAITNLLDQ